jgi:hypothetical protein
VSVTMLGVACSFVVVLVFFFVLSQDLSDVAVVGIHDAGNLGLGHVVVDHLEQGLRVVTCAFSLHQELCVLAQPCSTNASPERLDRIELDTDKLGAA